MAGITNICRLDVGRQFTRGHHVVVTANARALHFVVIHLGGHHRDPRISCGMAGVAQIRGIDMINALT